MDGFSFRSLGAAAAAAFLTACGTMSGVGYAGFGTRVASLDTDGDGGKIWSHYSNYSAATVRGLAFAHCSDRRKALSTFKLECSGGLLSFSGCGEFYQYSFRCALPSPPDPSLLSPPVPPVPLDTKSLGASEIEVLKNKCSELGFKIGTEKFGECVLRLSK